MHHQLNTKDETTVRIKMRGAKLLTKKGMYSFYEFLFVSIVFMMKQMLSVLLLNSHEDNQITKL